MLGGALSLAAATTLQQALPLPATANRLLSPEWEVVDLPVEKGVVLLDIGFTGTDPNHGRQASGESTPSLQARIVRLGRALLRRSVASSLDWYSSS